MGSGMSGDGREGVPVGLGAAPGGTPLRFVQIAFRRSLFIPGEKILTAQYLSGRFGFCRYL
jgi:hypothetical protein